MNKRFILTCCIVLCSVITSGCTSENKFSEKEEAVLVDYLSKKVLKRAKGYNYRLVNIYRSPFIREEIDESSVDIDQNVMEDLVEDNTMQDSNNTNTSDNVQTESSTSIGSALGLDEKIKVEVIKTKVVDDITKGAYYLEAKNGEKLVKVDIKITNTSSKNTQVKFKDTKCNLIIGDKEYSPLLTALENDLQFLSSKINKKKSLTTSLVFSVKEDDIKKDKIVKFKKDDIQATVSLD